jgi:hypothetical protein
MVASWPRSRSRDSNSPGPEAVPVNDQLLGVVTDCPPAQHLVVTMATTGLVDLTLALGAAKVRPPAATSSRCRRQPRTASQARATDGLGGGVAGRRRDRLALW